MARVSNVLTQGEFDAYAVFAQAQHLELDGAVGEANATALAEPIVTQGFYISAQTLASVFAQIRDRGVLVFKSKAKADYDVALNTFAGSQHNADVFESWFKSQKRHMTVDGDHGYENAVKVLQRMQGKEFNSQRLDLELSRCFATTTMHFIPSVDKAYLNSPHHSGSRKWDDSQQQQNAIAFTGGRSYRNEPAVEGTLERSSSRQGADAYWQSKCEGIGGTHSQRASLSRLFIQKADGTGVDWQATFQRRTSLAQNSR